MYNRTSSYLTLLLAMSSLLPMSCGNTADSPQASSALHIPAPPPPKPGLRLIDTMDYPDTKTARAAWSVQGGSQDDANATRSKKGTRPVEPVRLDGRPALRMPCFFEGNTAPRALWDRGGRLDLSRAAYITFDIYVAGMDAISHFSLYFKSGNGWYSGKFFPDYNGKWCRIRMLRSSFGFEGTPQGWNVIDTIRMSPWAMKRKNAVIYLANFGVEEPREPVLVVRRELKGKNRGSQKFLNHICSYTFKLLENSGIGALPVSDANLTAEILKTQKIIFLPHVPGLSADKIKLITTFIENGGRVIAMGSVAGSICKAMGVALGKSREAPDLGAFSGLVFDRKVLPGAPDGFGQFANSARELKAVGKNARVLAWWCDRFNRKQDAMPAAMISDAGVYFQPPFRNQDRKAKARVLAKLVLHFCPTMGRSMCERKLARVGRALKSNGFEEAWRKVNACAGRNQQVRTILSQARAQYMAALAKQKAGEFGKALDAADQADELLVRAYAMAQKPDKKEFRAAWCHSPEGLHGRTWDEAAEIMARNGFNNLIVNMMRGASCGYPSRVLPYHANYKEKPDYLAQCIQACHKRGIKVHVWMVNWNAGNPGSYISKAMAEKFKADGRTQVDKNGKVTYWLCPSNEKNAQMQIDAMVEAACKPGVDGIHFDYIRYPGGNTCFCKGCRAKFEAHIGRKVRNWPADVLEQGPLHKQWVDFRCDNITHVVRAVSMKVRKLAPSVKISAAVFRDYPACRENVGQDWLKWAKNGYVDFLCPMDYFASDSQFREVTANQLQQVGGKVPVYPGIGCHLDLGPCGTIRQILITRKHHTGGWVIFPYSQDTACDVFPYLGLGITPGKTSP